MFKQLGWEWELCTDKKSGYIDISLLRKRVYMELYSLRPEEYNMLLERGVFCGFSNDNKYILLETNLFWMKDAPMARIPVHYTKENFLKYCL